MRRSPRRAARAMAVAAAFVLAGSAAATASAAPPTSPAGPDLGPNVIVFDPSMPTSQIQATVDTIASKQVSNQFGTDRYALLFKPGTYGSSSDPLNFQVGYYTSIAASAVRRATSSSTDRSTSTTSATAASARR